MSNARNIKSIDIVRKIPKNSEPEVPFNPYKGQEYRLFLIWRFLPMEIKKGGRAYLEKAGIDDEDLFALAECKTMGDFSEKFGISRDTLTLWKQRPVPPEYEYIDWRIWAKQLTTSVVALLFEGIQEDKDAARIKLWLQAVDGYVEESNINGNISTETLNGVRKLVDGLNNAKVSSDDEQPAVS
jgi:hypothetical protein